MDRPTSFHLPRLAARAFVTILVLLPLSTSAAQLSKDQIADITVGGRLYDNWWVELKVKAPSQTHPAYPATGKQKGAGTWRCKECHGWDYLGRDGAYAQGSHATGIKGIQGAVGSAPERIIAVLKDKKHGYDKVLPDKALRQLAAFVRDGQIDMYRYMDRASKKVKGDAKTGKGIYDNRCARCHGEDGRTMNFSTKAGEVDYVGTIAKNIPWEALHKIRNGHPGAYMSHDVMHKNRALMDRMHRGLFGMGEQMPAMLGELTPEDQAALLAYLQTLPEK